MSATWAASIHGRQIIEVEAGIIPAGSIGPESRAVAVHNSAGYSLPQRAIILPHACIPLARIPFVRLRLCFCGVRRKL